MFTALKRFITPNSLMDIPTVDLGGDFTPDWWKLEQFERQLLFVDGTLMSGQANDFMVKEFSHVPMPIHPTVYTHADYTFWMKDLGRQSFPVMLPENYRPTGFVRWPIEPLRVRGELWAIRPQAFKKYIDEHMQNGVRYTRVRIKITLPYREIGWSKDKPLVKLSEYKTAVREAWAYVGIPEYWDPLIGGVFSGSQVLPRELDDHRPYVNQFYRFEPPF